jgi:hypothetical protein
MPIGPRPFRVELVACIRRLAAASDAQVEYLHNLGVYPCADELALELHELALLSREKVRSGEISFAEKAAVEQLDRELRTLSGPENASLWTADALESAVQWRKVRMMASDCLTVLGAEQ